MGTIDRLWEDHRQLCTQLDALAATLTRVPTTWRQLRDGCVSLARMLEAHHQREAAAITACRDDLVDGEALAQVAIEHWDRWLSLRIINRNFTNGAQSVKDISDALTAVIDGLREECQMQEQALFPVLECVLNAKSVDRFVLAAP